MAAEALQAVEAGTPPTPATLAPTSLIDSDHPAVAAFAQEHAHGANDTERAVALYHAVRDGFRYDPYRIDLNPEGMRASAVIANGHGWCVPKAALLAAACRAAGIPARVGFADVRNHLSTERLRRDMATDLFIWHGYTDIWLPVGGSELQPGRWVKATPAFNLSLCQRFGLLPLEFDGTADSIYHPYDRSGQRHMEYVAQRGAWDDVPLARMVGDFRELYPRWTAQSPDSPAAEFLADVAREMDGTSRN